MRLESVLSLTNAALVSQPDIRTFDQIVFNASKVRRGDIYVAYEPSGIPEAIANGAYAVLFETPETVSDPEIAWIKVSSLDEALLRLLRFHLLDKSLRPVACDPATLALAEQMIKDETCIVIRGSIQEQLPRLWNIADGCRVFFANRKSCRDLFIRADTIPQTVEPYRIVEQTLFESSFYMHGVYHHRKGISPFFLPYLNRLSAFLDQNGLQYSISGMQHSSHFAPLFVSESLQAKPFGHGNRVIIFESELHLLAEEIAYLAASAKWADTLFLVPESFDATLPESSRILRYCTKEDIIAILKTTPFHFALVGGQTRDLFDTMQKPTAPTLFSLENMR